MRYTPILIILVLVAGCGKKQPVSFKSQIQPILNARCTQCHGTDIARGKIVMSSTSFMNSHTISGKEPLVVPGNPYQSRLYILCETNQPHFRMPPDTSRSTAPLPPGELELLRHWIAEGAKDN